MAAPAGWMRNPRLLGPSGTVVPSYCNLDGSTALMLAAFKIFGAEGEFDYFDHHSAFGYERTAKGDMMLGRAMDFGGPNAQGIWIHDGFPDVNCHWLWKTPARELGCDGDETVIATDYDGFITHQIKKGDIFRFFQKGYFHEGFIASAPIIDKNGASFTMYHCMERGVGTTRLDICTVRPDGKVEIRGPGELNPKKEVLYLNEFCHFPTNRPISNLKLEHVVRVNCCKPTDLQICDWISPFLPLVQVVPSVMATTVGSAAGVICNWPTKPEEAGPEITIDPLLLDLDGDGISTLSQENGVFFDFDANGFHELSGWIGAGSGLLMLDLNGNGELDDGSELFGDFTMMPTGENAGNGFHALSQYDDNMDGRIDANDAVWSQLGVYYDTQYYTPESAGGG